MFKATKTTAVSPATRDLILDQAERLIATKGLYGFTPKDIGEPLGVVVAALYKHYENRDDFLVALSSALRRRAVGFVFAIVFAMGAAQQTKSRASQLKALPMPQDRIAASYDIYSQLLPGDEIEWGNAPRSFWLLEDATKAEPLDNSCDTGGMMNPHQAIEAPPARKADFVKVLADFDAHCHESYLLDASKFRLQVPVHLLDEAARRRFVNHVKGYMPPKNNIMQAPPTPDEFKGAAGMHSFTAVYFNRAHTLAMTEIGMYCGGLCGNWRWVVLERRGEQWQVLPWVGMSMMS
jgi:AcrR family transcriptional regulator